MNTDKFKVVMLGDFAVGKTSLVKRFVLDIFNDLYLTTIGVKVLKKEMVINNCGGARNVTMLLWDIGGLADFTMMMPQYLQGAFGAVIVADLSRINRLPMIENHIASYRKVNPDGTFVIAFNKCDLVLEDEFIGSIEGIMKSYESRFNSPVFLTSAKTGENVEKLFSVLATKMLERIL